MRNSYVLSRELAHVNTCRGQIFRYSIEFLTQIVQNSIDKVLNYLIMCDNEDSVMIIEDSEHSLSAVLDREESVIEISLTPAEKADEINSENQNDVPNNERSQPEPEGVSDTTSEMPVIFFTDKTLEIPSLKLALPLESHLDPANSEHFRTNLLNSVQKLYGIEKPSEVKLCPQPYFFLCAREGCGFTTFGRKQFRKHFFNHCEFRAARGVCKVIDCNFEPQTKDLKKKEIKDLNAVWSNHFMAHWPKVIPCNVCRRRVEPKRIAGHMFRCHTSSEKQKERLLELPELKLTHERRRLRRKLVRAERTAQNLQNLQNKQQVSNQICEAVAASNTDAVTTQNTVPTLPGSSNTVPQPETENKKRKKEQSEEQVAKKAKVENVPLNPRPNRFIQQNQPSTSRALKGFSFNETFRKLDLRRAEAFKAKQRQERKMKQKQEKRMNQNPKKKLIRFRNFTSNDTSFQCILCIFKTHDLQELTDHCDGHSERLFQCNVCNFRTCHPVLYSIHTKSDGHKKATGMLEPVAPLAKVKKEPKSEEIEFYVQKTKTEVKVKNEKLAEN